VIQWIRARLLAGFFVMVPVIVSLAALYWIFGIIDRFTAPLAERVLGQEAGPVGRAAIAGLGIVTTMLVVLAVGAVATNVIGRRVLNRAESWLMMIPVFRTIYAPVKQLVVASSPGNEYGFKRVVLVEDAAQRWVMGFLTKEFTVDRGKGPETLIAVYVPTNHLYIGDVLIFPRERAVFPDLDVEEGIRIFLTGGMSLPGGLGSLPSPANRLDARSPRPGKPA
jgi:uncharacterized membrane protein